MKQPLFFDIILSLVILLSIVSRHPWIEKNIVKTIFIKLNILNILLLPYLDYLKNGIPINIMCNKKWPYHSWLYNKYVFNYLSPIIAGEHLGINYVSECSCSSYYKFVRPRTELDCFATGNRSSSYATGKAHNKPIVSWCNDYQNLYE